MYERLGEVRLKSGEVVEAGVVACPDADWSARMCRLLGHKSSFWSWHIEKATRESLEAETRFYLLHRDGDPLANIMTVERDGVGVLGHVYTAPTGRRQGAASGLMAFQMAEFQRRGGRALHLGTDYDSAPYHIYHGFGFRPVEPKSGVMVWYATDETSFEQEWFGDVSEWASSGMVEAFDWRHWPRSSPLIMLGEPGVVRLAAVGTLRRTSSESLGLKLLSERFNREERNLPPTSAALAHPATGAVAGLAMWHPDRTWPRTTVLDLWCHPQAWRESARLIEALPKPESDGQVIAYVDSRSSAKRAALEATGFKVAATLPRQIPADVANTGRLDVHVLHREG